MKQYASECVLVEYYRSEFVVFNDPDETEYLQDDGDNPLDYLDDTFTEKWTVYTWGAMAKPEAFTALWYDTPRYEVWQIIAMNMTHNKLTNKSK